MGKEKSPRSVFGPLSKLKKLESLNKQKQEYERMTGGRTTFGGLFNRSVPLSTKANTLGYGAFSALRSASDFRQRNIAGANAISGRYKQRGYKAGGGRGRPKGPSGKYYIPGVGPVGVYEYRIWLRAQLRNKRLEIQGRQQLSPEQRMALQQLQARQQSQQINPERRVIPDTRGDISIGNVHQEIEDYANEVP